MHLKKVLAAGLAVCMMLASPVSAFASKAENLESLQYSMDTITEHGIGMPYFRSWVGLDNYKTAKEISAEIVGDETDPYEKAKLIFKFLMKNNVYHFAKAGMEAPSWNKSKNATELFTDGLPFSDSPDSHVLYENGYLGICGDFARVFCELCWTQDIPCIDVDGSINGGSHAWNVFYANGEWHWVDTTPYVDMTKFDMDINKMAEHYYGGSPTCETKASSWAIPYLRKAREQGLLDIGFMSEITPSDSKIGIDFSGRYPVNNCTRLQFAQLAVNLLEVCYDKDIDEILAEKGVSISYDTFKDTQEKDVLAAYALGMVSGYDKDNFNPKGKINRQEAAAILYRTAKVLGIEEEGADLSVFTDLHSINNWARESVAFCKAAGIMSGTTETTFDPMGMYSREQCITTIVRLYDAAMAN